VGSFNASVALDYRVSDGTQTVTFSGTRPPAVGQSSGAFSLTINFAEPHDYTLKEVSNGQGFVMAGDRRWALGNAEFTGGITPQRGDSITEANGTVWMIEADPTLDPLGISWLCQTRKAR